MPPTISLSFQPLASRLRAVTNWPPFVMPNATNGPPGRSNLFLVISFLMSKSRKPSSPPESNCPSSRNLTAQAFPLCSRNVCVARREATSHSLTKPSSAADASLWPSALKDSPRTADVCASRYSAFCKLRMLLMLMAPSP